MGARLDKTLGLLVLLAATLGCSLPAMAIYSAKEVFEVHQGSWDVANDLHIKFWQKEDYIQVLDWEVGDLGGLPQPTNLQRGDQPEPYHSRTNGGNTGPDNGTHAVDLDWDNLDIPFCTNVWLEFTWWLTEKNTKRVQVNWTQDGVPGDNDPANHGWDVGPPVPQGGGLYAHTVHICNDDDPNDPLAKDLILRNVKYSVVHGLYELSADDLWGWSDWLAAPTSDIVLHPSECMSFDVITDVGWDGHILGSYEVWYPDGGGVGDLGVSQVTSGQIQVYEVFDHPTVPEPTSLLLVFCGVLLCGMNRIRRTR